MRVFFRFKFSFLRLLFFIFIWTFLTFLFCESFVYYLQFFLFCGWPSDASIEAKKVLVLSDTHLLGKIKGHWFDKLKREWQMYQSFQTSIQLFKPEVVFILGDVFDEGQWARPEDFQEDVSRFYRYFHVPANVKLYVVAGNHDIGFHYRTHPILYNRFDYFMNTTTVDYFNLSKSILVIRINSIALENDGCSLCDEAQKKIKFISKQIAHSLPSNIIVLTHFPLYRPSESVCSHDEDSLPEDENKKPNREGLDCLTLKSSQFILDQLKPNLILNGHVHYSCSRERKIKDFKNNLILSEEITVSSYNWRNRKNPSFLLLQIDDMNHWIKRCYVPNENIILLIYGASLISMIIFVIVKIKKSKID